jgi:Nucleotide modification associated domain 2
LIAERLCWAATIRQKADDVKLSAYIVMFDAGFAPNPFGRVCTLACCKPTIRRKAEPGDIVVGTGSTRYKKSGHLIYAMRVGAVVALEEYWRRFPSKRPTPETAIKRRGDNIWYYEKGRWKVVSGAIHDARHRDHDISGKNALIATEYFYFGIDAPEIPDHFRDLLATTQGHKNSLDRQKTDRFWSWIKSQAGRRGRIADPCEFTHEACRAQCGQIENEDVEEICRTAGG